jgi:urease accessory protein
MTRLARRTTWTGLLLSTISTAQAHHPMGGDTPTNSVEGLLSGLGHPIIDAEHLAFIIAAGLIISAIHKQRLTLLLAFLASTLLGALAHLSGFGLAAGQPIIAASVVLAGLWLVSKSPDKPRVLAVFFSLAGIFHGNAYAESIIGAEPAPIVAYLIGFTAVQGLMLAAIAAGTAAARNQWSPVTDGLIRAAGLVLAIGGGLLAVP